jgi:hypothetical protein
MYVCVYMYYCVRMYTMHVYSTVCVCILCMCMCILLCVYSILHARALLLLCLRSVCVDVPVLVYCMYVVSMVVAMGSSCRTYVVGGVVYVSTASLRCMYYSRCVLLLMIVSAKA